MSESAFDDESSDVRVQVTRLGSQAAEFASDQVAREVPVALEFNGVSHAVMLASPSDLEDFAIGFSLAEGIVRRVSDIRDMTIVASPEGLTVRMDIATSQFIALKERRRNLAGRTGCGLCGTESLSEVMRPPQTVPAGVMITPAMIVAGFRKLGDAQTLMRRTGSVHGAGFMMPTEKVHWVREDVGRHNALDKTVGAAARFGADLSGGAFLVTSRASIEMVQKAITAGASILAAISAPTSLAIEVALRSGLTLVGFVRGSSMVVYAHGHRLGLPEGTVTTLGQRESH